jgi:hypothetical protein
VLVKRTTVPLDEYRTEKILGWVEPNAITTLPGTVGMDSASYRLRVYAPDGRQVAEINASQDEIDRQMRGHVWPIEIRKPVPQVRKVSSHHK